MRGLQGFVQTGRVLEAVSQPGREQSRAGALHTYGNWNWQDQRPTRLRALPERRSSPQIVLAVALAAAAAASAAAAATTAELFAAEPFAAAAAAPAAEVAPATSSESTMAISKPSGRHVEPQRSCPNKHRARCYREVVRLASVPWP